MLATVASLSSPSGRPRMYPSLRELPLLLSPPQKPTASLLVLRPIRGLARLGAVARHEKPDLITLPIDTHTLREIIDPRIHQATKLSPATVAESASNSPRNRARNSDDGGATRRR